MRDNHTCQKCGTREEWGYELHVHHKRYISGREPWEYGTGDLTTLCKRCHCKENVVEDIKPSTFVTAGSLVQAIMKRLAKASAVTPCNRSTTEDKG